MNKKKLYQKATIALDTPCTCGELHGVLWNNQSITCFTCRNQVKILPDTKKHILSPMFSMLEQSKLYTLYLTMLYAYVMIYTTVEQDAKVC